MKAPEVAITLMAGVPIVPARYGRQAMQNPLDISHEVRMAKSALLYADRVSIASWRMSLVRAWAEIGEARERGQVGRLVELYLAVEWARGGRGVVSSNARLEGIVEAAKGRLTIGQIEREIGPFMDEGLRSLQAAYSHPSWRELNRAVELGALEIERMGSETPFGFSREAAIAEYMSLISRHLEPDAPGVPMLDFSAAGVFQVGSDVGLLERPLPDSAKEVSLASHYMGYIPAVGAASIDSVLKAREQLKGPLVRFRALMSELATEVETSPIAPGFANAADDLFRREMAPQLEVIREESRERGLGKLLLEEIVHSKSGPVTRAVIGLAAAGMAGLPMPAQAGIGATVLTAELAGGVAKRRRELEVRRNQNSLLWMYEMESRLNG